ncbi:hypothetical protein [Rhodoferax sp. U11-2br]|uniref:hypothetical protein n=1 Tax=Rhodoferax sp. U11-2br TaxID=2838878 RepID=UPI001BEBCDC6|nr:hypothetical protein [Rhodoferax sp. U11-2br]MBT3068005.1 hypothetical protein [Rhodoferax sp. U11-2br]
MTRKTVDLQHGELPHKPKPPIISFWEILLCASYFLAVWLIPTSWLDSGIGSVAFALASKVNPYLSEYSIAFAAEPQYFIHCHVLATWLLPSFSPYLEIRRNGGRSVHAEHFHRQFERFGGWFYYLAFNCIFLIPLYFGMYWMVDYPLDGPGEKGVWIGMVSLYAMLQGGMLGATIYLCYMIFYSAFFARRQSDELRRNKW